MSHIRNLKNSQGKQNFKLGLLYSLQVLKISLWSGGPATPDLLFPLRNNERCTRTSLSLQWRSLNESRLSVCLPPSSPTRASPFSGFCLGHQTGFRCTLLLVIAYPQLPGSMTSGLFSIESSLLFLFYSSQVTQGQTRALLLS